MNLSACQTTKTKTEYVNVYRTEYVYPPESLLTPCPAQEDLSFTTNGEMLMSLIDLSTKYAVCSARMSAVIQYVSQMCDILDGCNTSKAPVQNVTLMGTD